MDIKVSGNKLEITEVIPESSKVTSLSLDELQTILLQHQAAQDSWTRVLEDAQEHINQKQVDIDYYTDLITQAKSLGLKTIEEVEAEGKLVEPIGEEPIGG